MLSRARTLWLSLSGSLGFVPGVLVAVFAGLGIGLVELDRTIDLEGAPFVFQGDGSAARTVLSVIAGSLITVAGLTFSITMVVLQLASSQFSPRVLRTFFGDRITQVTIGTYVGTFVYALLVLRAVGSFGDSGFVPRLSVTVASLLGIAVVVLLIVYLGHVARMVQVSHVTASIAAETLAAVDDLFPDRLGHPAEAEDATALLQRWRCERRPAAVSPRRPGYVRRIAADDLAAGAGAGVERLAILTCPGDFASPETPIIEVWPPDAVSGCRDGLLKAVSIAGERDLDQDVDFGLRQLADIALRAMSPGVNDPMTAVTCISYLRSIVVRLTERAAPPAVRRFEHPDLVVVFRRRTYDEYLDAFRQIGRYAGGDAWVAGALLDALTACAAAAMRCGGRERAEALRAVGSTIAEQARAEVVTRHDRQMIGARLAALEAETARAG
jgi:uncharacterized membrane protein